MVDEIKLKYDEIKSKYDIYREYFRKETWIRSKKYDYDDQRVENKFYYDLIGITMPNLCNFDENIHNIVKRDFIVNIQGVGNC